ncbi:Uma2 family endonuclease [Deinococcus arenicola]|uniref:Uma2 family endonuclease n=1 Tax=Deinococcus arenicola TaxID=2994950 RepID=A0ABU4DPA3_9DEIO|nr:Uma2 family endonuclease [Deinococcus sp. ZS9-10]MDV6374203.1 Uma2 family endonuclease [Deinococcus sp. ZS9-10]
MSEPAYQHMTEEEYLASEELSPVKREYVGGYVYALHGDTLAQAGASSRHGEITLNIAGNLQPLARTKRCKVYASDMRVNCATPVGKWVYYYPDVVATCEKVDGKAASISAPSLIVEVLSPRTRHTDLTDKIWAYTSLASLQTYLIVEADTRLVRAIERQPDDSWS